MELLQFEKKYRVHVYETGPDGKLNLYSLFNYMQDIASDHAVKLGFGRDDLLRDNRFWVLSRIYVVIKEWPVWEDSIIVNTWPNGTDNIFALRNYEVKYPDGRHIASGTSSWLILDRTTKKVQRPDSILSQYNSDLHSESSPIRYATKIDPAAESGQRSPIFRIKVSDLDVNLHTNNVRYLKWVNDCYNLDFVMNNEPQSAEINYLAESMFDEEILIRTSVENQDECFYNHSILRANDIKELCRIRIEWKKRNTKQTN
ncbi:MAG TPA: acyl-ACP thioesterase domain-containing protein [Bacteroidales bacterium]